MKHQNGFSLFETLVGIVVLAFSVAGSFEILRLSELKQRHALVDIRVGEILREYTDYLLYISYDLLPSDGAVISSGDLYQVYNQVTGNWTSFYHYQLIAHATLGSPGTSFESKWLSLVLSYQSDAPHGNQSSQNQTISTDAVQRFKP